MCDCEMLNSNHLSPVNLLQFVSKCKVGQPLMFIYMIHIFFHWFSMKNWIVFSFNFDRVVLIYFFPLSKFTRNLHRIPNWNIINDLDDISLVVMQATWNRLQIIFKRKNIRYCLLPHLYFINIFCELKYRCVLRTPHLKGIKVV